MQLLNSSEKNKLKALGIFKERKKRREHRKQDVKWESYLESPDLLCSICYDRKSEVVDSSMDPHEFY